MARGWLLVLWTAVIVGALVVALYAASPGDAGLGAGLRLTARTSLVLFLLAWSASSLHALWRHPSTRWLLANRRYLGVSFAVSHGIHGVLIWTRAYVSGMTAAVDNLSGLAGGSLAFLFLAAMTITSFDRPAAALGRRRWKLLHTAGGYWILFIFTASYAKRLAGGDPFHVAALALIAFAIAARVAAGLRRRA